MFSSGKTLTIISWILRKKNDFLNFEDFGIFDDFESILAYFLKGKQQNEENWCKMKLSTQSVFQGLEHVI